LGVVPLVSREENKKKKKIREKISREGAKPRSREDGFSL
jgi:hypothetical protein